MNVKELKRNPTLAKTHFITTDQGSLLTKHGLSIMIPKRFVEVSLATVGSDNEIVGICAWIIGNEYFITLTNALFKITPDNITETIVDGDVYVSYNFDKNSVVMPNTNLLKSSGIVFHIFNELIAKGKVPWYINYLDRLNIFDSANKHAGVSFTDQKEVTEMIVAVNTRFKDNINQYYRHVIKKEDDLISDKHKPTSLRDVEFSATTTLNKLMGSYMNRAITSSLNHPSERVEKLEEYLRM